MDWIAVLSFLPQLALTESISINPPIDLPSRACAVKVIEQGIFPFGSHSTHTRSLSLFSARCCQGYRAAGEAAGVGGRAGSQAAISEEGPSE